MLNQDIIREATRLTRVGRPVEATGLLQRMLRGDRAPDAPSSAGGRTALAPPHVIDAKANVIEETDYHPQSKPAAAAQPRMFRTTLGRSGIRLPVKRAPLSTPDIAPEGARFIECAYGNREGSRAYRLFIPSSYQERPLPLVVMLHGCTQSPDDFAAGTRMNFIAEEQCCFVAYPAQPRQANQGKCWNWFAQPTSSATAASPRLSPASPAKSWMIIGLIESASMLVGCRPERPPRLSWEKPITICTRQSEYIPASRAGLPRICPPRLSRCDKAGPITG